MSPDTIYHGDCIEVLNGFPPKCVDLIFADPPYNLQLKKELLRPNQSQVDGVSDDWDRFGSFAEYDAFTRDWLSACRRVLKDTGAIWVIGSYHNIHRVGTILQDLGYWILNDVSWIKTNPMPNFRGVRLCNAHETLIWAKKSERQKRYTFNYKALKLDNKGLQMRSDWYFPICSGPERLRQEGVKFHSTQKPEALIERIIRGCSNPGDLVLDPLCGTGTTPAVAKRLARRYIGIDREGKYVRAAESRLNCVISEMFDPLYVPPAPPRVPFRALIELGLLRPETDLQIGKNRLIARVTDRGTLARNGTEASIHRMGAKLLGWPACNGWEHWRYPNEAGEYRPLDELRAKAREMLGLAG